MTLDTSKTTADLFRDLNTLRKAQGMLPLKAWKESRSKLEAAITKLLDNDAATETKRAPAKKGTKARVLAAEAEQAKKDLAPTSFAAFLAKNKVNAKVARAKLRRAGLKGPYTLSDEVKAIVTSIKAKA